MLISALLPILAVGLFIDLVVRLAIRTVGEGPARSVTGSRSLTVGDTVRVRMVIELERAEGPTG